MTNEEKELLIKDLSARLPYGVIVKIKNKDNEERTVDLTYGNIDYVFTLGDWWKECKPYLRQMSSMTAEEKEELWGLLKKLGMTADVKRLDWLVANHFDIRNLIGKGLALEAPAEMYNKEDKE